MTTDHCARRCSPLRCPPSCNRGATTGNAGTAKPTVALVLKTLNHPFFVDMRRGAQEAADRLGVDLQVQAAEREIDVEKQMQIVENLIQTGIQALCITPSGSREIVSALVKAKDAKVPIIVVDTRVDAKAAADAGVQHRDVRRLRQLRGRQARRRIPGQGHRRQGARRHPRGHSRPRDRRLAAARLPRRRQGLAGHHDRRVAAGELGARPGLQRVPEHAAGASRTSTRVFACSDLMALGAIEAIAAAGKTGKIRVDRLRRAGRCEEGDCGGDDGGVGGAVPVGDGQASRSRARSK